MVSKPEVEVVSESLCYPGRLRLVVGICRLALLSVGIRTVGALLLLLHRELQLERGRARQRTQHAALSVGLGGNRHGKPGTQAQPVIAIALNVRLLTLAGASILHSKRGQGQGGGRMRAAGGGCVAR